MTDLSPTLTLVNGTDVRDKETVTKTGAGLRRREQGPTTLNGDWRKIHGGDTVCLVFLNIFLLV